MDSNDVSKTPRPTRVRRPRPVSQGTEWQPAENVPGGVLPAVVARQQFEVLREIDDAQRRARVRADTYYVG